MDTKEKRFESDIENSMLTQGGFTKGDLKTYDREKAIDLPKLIAFVEKTQPKQWERYKRNYGTDAEKKFYKRFQESIDTFGLLYVLRHGFEDRGAKIEIVAFKENNNRSQKVIDDYNSNIVTCTRQFKYSAQNENSIDMVLSVNGIPLVALELKNQLTGQSIANAKKQFMYDRNPRELCFQFDKRFLVYFAVDLNEIAMTTRLAGKDTFFLPFNQGTNGAGEVGGAGNPENPNGYTTSYLWEKVLTRDNLLELIHKFIQRVEEEKILYKNGTETKKKSVKLIFPRYHQLDVVNKLVADVKANGSGKNYLIQHSAGSGKSNSIAWLAYELSELHDQNDKPVFTSIIVINDRTVLDRQIQNTIFSFDHIKGMVEKIDDEKHSSDLKDAINDGKKIIITTLQKFPYIYDEINDTTDKRFAVIVDEAHSSQSGKTAGKLKAALADTEEALREFAEIEGREEQEIKDEEDKLVEQMLTHGKHKNLSFFAFTATPKEATLEVFGVKLPNGKFRAFHIYSMRQAIEEGFILDVLKNYMTYKNCYRIAKNTPGNPELPASQALKAIQRYESLHPHNLQQKTAIIVETFRSVTKNKINGNAKAMVVTASRLHAIRYYHEFKRYLERKGYHDLEILVAFSGIVKDGEKEYTEEGINKRKDGTRVKESQLPAEFHKDEYAMLIVAEKYQTGFDEPLLHTMFVDKKLKGVKAVQTLSRLNRTCSGKTDTFVLDFVNTAEEIKEAFEPYFECTELDQEINVNLIYDTRTMLRSYGLYNEEDIEKLLKIFYKKSPQNDTDLGKMAGVLTPVINRYKALPEDKRFDYKKLIHNFNKWYSYIIQISRMFDMSLQKEFHFTQYLEKMLPPATDEKPVDLEDKLRLEFYKLEQTFKGDISLNPTVEASTLVNPKTLKTSGKGMDKDELLDVIIDKINEKYLGFFLESDRVVVEQLYNRCVKYNDKIKMQARKNDEEVFNRSIFPEIFKKVAQECYMEQMKAFSKLFEDKIFYNSVMESMAAEAYKDLRNR
ncbi:DEAD/DEAH box helicase family protein [Candidatus Merdisoma sp. JLR.KK006]|jgi:type I restriction enzyme R subunit|uniref:type I restriction endonuclease subunit R n=1 Tax=Candidatus Merdisoma sp. JLR.KK006 TaxID=3112626 RepID=UPI002FF081F6